MSKGFAFITFYKKDDAERARQNTNHLKILEKTIRVSLYKQNFQEQSENQNLFVKNVPNTVTPKEFEEYFANTYGPVFSSKLNIHDSKEGAVGYGFIHFENGQSV